MIHERLHRHLQNNHCTLLGVGPMSRNCVDAAIELSSSANFPLILIASRRQIDSDEFGGGYVNGWTTSEYANYVTTNDKRGNIYLARDHGGPWQHPSEVSQQLSLKHAMESAKRSYANDIDSGFQIIHIDPSVDIHGKSSPSEILERVYELYEFCWSYARRSNKEIIFEIGTEEQSGSTNSQEELEFTLRSLFAFTKVERLPSPSFVVIQAGTRVMETRNVGSFDSPVRVADEIPAEIQLPKMIDVCNKFGVFMKEHNTDYLSDEGLRWHPRLGIHSANVAPEFGVAETRAFLKFCSVHELKGESEAFLKIAYESQKWSKWMLPETEATDEDRAIIAGHYVFSTPEFIELKNSVELKSEKKGLHLDHYLRSAVKTSILRYLTAFKLV